MRTEADIAKIVAFGEKRIQGLPEEAVLRQFNTAVNALLEGKPTPLSEVSNVLRMFRLDTESADGVTFESRFLFGVPEVRAAALSNKSNETARGIYYAPSLVRLNGIVDMIDGGLASLDQRYFLNGLRVSIYKQLHREGEDKFCDMACDLALRMIQMNSASFDDETTRRILMMRAPIDRERHFTKVTDDMLVAPAQIAGHLLTPALKEAV